MPCVFTEIVILKDLIPCWKTLQTFSCLPARAIQCRKASCTHLFQPCRLKKHTLSGHNQFVITTSMMSLNSESGSGSMLWTLAIFTNNVHTTLEATSSIGIAMPFLADHLAGASSISIQLSFLFNCGKIHIKFTTLTHL